MGPKPTLPNSGDLYRSRLDQILDPRHALFRLAGLIDWDRFDQEFGRFYRPLGRPAKPTRLMVGLSYLQHTFNLSDEAVVQRWIENPYYQWFCGCEYFQHELPCDPSSLTRWRKRLGPEGLEKLLAATIQAGLESGAVRPSSLERISVDTTVQPKAITHPTDAKLYLKALQALVRQAKRHGLQLRQAHTRVAKRAAVQVGRYAHARQMRRMLRELKRLKTYLGRVYRDVARKVAGDEVLSRRFAPLLGLTERLLVQERTSKNKLYSLHAPEVVCIAKGKAHRPYEFGSKVAVAVTNREGFVLASKALEGNSYDGHTLDATIDQVIALTGVEPERTYVDQGYRGHDYSKTDRVFITRQWRGLTPTIKRELRRRSAIEPMIGHMKADGRLWRRCQAGLNKGEAAHKLKRAVFFHERGEIRDRSFESQAFRASGLNLVVSAIIHWNTVYLGRAVDHLRRQGRIVRPEVLKHVSPLSWEHIKLTGTYAWGEHPVLVDGFRPLRLPKALAHAA